MKYGFIGVGAIASAMVTGICKDNDDAPEILVSPRNHAMASHLARIYPTVEVAKSNQAVVDNADAAIICLRPAAGRSELGALKFSDESVVISAMAGVPLDELKSLAYPAKTIARIIPLPRIAVRGSVTAIYPPNDIARELFDTLGGSVEVTGESSFDAFSAATATIAAHFGYLNTIAGWLKEHGVPAEGAAKYVSSIFVGLGEALKMGEDLDELVKEHATPGGINELFLKTLTEHGVRDEITGGLDLVFYRLTGNS
ncbi:MAG TPA: NAD(P)-binding domain-containing protein [Pyrinomonadaceae bacterium]|jgi:pyrroline-5-carboxylate reductase|nr:NAD(P)-binding domain-containing protein [Pyrinomonadaceae bacterium]